MIEAMVNVSNPAGLAAILNQQLKAAVAGAAGNGSAAATAQVRLVHWLHAVTTSQVLKVDQAGN